MPILHTESAVVEKSSLLQPRKQNVFPLLRLPRELRDTIYRHAIAAGNTEVLRVSKLVKEEASEHLSKHGILRVNLGYVDRTNWVHLGSQPKISFQHVELRLSTGPGVPPFNSAVLSGLGGNEVIRKSCVVILNYGKEGSAPYSINRHWLYLHLQRLNGFKSLVVKIIIERYKFAEFEGLLTEEAFLRIFPYESRLLSHHRESYQRVRGFLELNLGPAKFDDSVNGHCLEFQPLEPLPDNWKHEFKVDE